MWMGCFLKAWMVVFVISYFQYDFIEGAPQVPCFFVFGDSLSDNGNNNLLPTRAKVNYPPYGVDYELGPTGRFSNGKNVIDIFGEFLGFETPIPPFSIARTNNDILRGVNYASGSAGIRDETGSQLGENIPLNKQLEYHKATIASLVNMQGGLNSAMKHVNKCLYSVYMGSNDYFNNYFQPTFFNSSKIFTAKEFADVLIEEYSQQLRTLYSYGARKIVLFGLGPIGCTPYAIDNFGKGGLCVDKMNDAVGFFNSALRSLTKQLNKDLTDAKFIIVSPGFPLWGTSHLNGIKHSTSNLFGKSHLNGIKHSTSNLFGKSHLNVFDGRLIKGCCEVNSDGQCVPDSVPCRIRSLYIFWDSFHPTESSNRIMALMAYSTYEMSIAYPYNISTLIQL